MNTMTLEQLRDRLRDIGNNTRWAGPGLCLAMADAITTHLTAREAKVDETTTALEGINVEPPTWLTKPRFQRADCDIRPVVVNYRDLQDLLDANLAAADQALALTGGIDAIEENGGADSDEPMDRVAYNLFYGLFAAQRLRDQAERTHPAAQEVAKPDEWERAVIEHAMVTEAVSIEGRKPYDIVSEIIAWHVAAASRCMGEPPLAGRWHHGKGFLCCGAFRVAREDWEADVCAAPGMRAEVFNWICERLNAAKVVTQLSGEIPGALTTHDAGGFGGMDERERGYFDGWNAYREALIDATRDEGARTIEEDLKAAASGKSASGDNCGWCDGRGYLPGDSAGKRCYYCKGSGKNRGQG